MSRIKSQHTAPEMIVRRTVHRMGFRYRLHATDLPGKPDLVFPKFSSIIEVRGCFWHQHPNCIDSHIPKSRKDYWGPKLTRNVQRDRQNEKELRKLGWRVLVIWECETKNLDEITRRIQHFLPVLNHKWAQLKSTYKLVQCR